MRSFGRKKERGVALMLVLSSIMVLYTMGIEFAYNTMVEYHIANNNLERLQAYYLARSAMSLIKLEIKMDKFARNAVAQSQASQYVGGGMSEPICQQYPFSTAMLRGFMEAGVFGKKDGEEAPVEKETPEGEVPEKKDEPSAMDAAFVGSKAEKFLDFNGDFEGTCEDEQSKINLNLFYSLVPEQETLSGFNDYDLHKELITMLLTHPRYKNLFDGKQKGEIGEIIRNIADWIDPNQQINDMGRMTRGNEQSLYNARENEIQVKNVKLFVLDDVNFIAGVSDDWLMPVRELFTVYGDGKINACLASDEVIAALIERYVAHTPDLTPLDPNNKDQMPKLVEAVKGGCTGVQPSAEDVAKALDAVLRGTGTVAGTPNPASIGRTSFVNSITGTTRYYSLKLSGQVGNTMVHIDLVIDTQDPDPKRWKTLYYKVY